MAAPADVVPQPRASRKLHSAKKPLQLIPGRKRFDPIRRPARDGLIPFSLLTRGAIETRRAPGASFSNGAKVRVLDRGVVAQRFRIALFNDDAVGDDVSVARESQSHPRILFRD